MDSAQEVRNRLESADASSADFWFRMSLRKMRQKTAVESERPTRSSAEAYLLVKSASAAEKLNPSGVAMLMNDSSHVPATEKVDERVNSSIAKDVSIGLDSPW